MGKVLLTLTTADWSSGSWFFFEVLSFIFFYLLSLSHNNAVQKNDKLLISMCKVNRNGDNLSDII